MSVLIGHMSGVKQNVISITGVCVCLSVCMERLVSDSSNLFFCFLSVCLALHY